MSAVLREALDSLADLPDRTPLVDEAEGLRELRVRFGKYGYAIHYSVESEVVLVTQIFHVREAR
jgi:plasmid stabilization system protein ParE